VLSVVGGDGQALNVPGQAINIKSGSGSNNFGTGDGAGAGGTINLTAGSGGSGTKGGNGGQIILQPGAAGTGNPNGNGVQGNVLIVGDDNGSFRSGAPEQLVIEGSSNSAKQLLIGYLADSTTNAGYGALQATFTNHQDTPLLLNPLGGGVGIATFQLSGTNSLTIGQGQGAALADGWATYSSRRWKTNIQTLPDALDKVERLRGVSYDLKENGKHEIGVIAEEVGAVVPEIVQWDKNGKDANGVDYSRLTALLIEAVKQQQAQLNAQQAKSKLQEAQITELRSQLKTIQASHKANGRTGSEVRTLNAHRSMLQN
jgi:hypothetical protein